MEEEKVKKSIRERTIKQCLQAQVCLCGNTWPGHVQTSPVRLDNRRSGVWGWGLSSGVRFSIRPQFQQMAAQVLFGASGFFLNKWYNVDNNNFLCCKD